jgi:hypothetical protein
MSNYRQLFLRVLKVTALVSEEEMSLGLINSLGDLNELQEQFMKTTEGGL